MEFREVLGLRSSKSPLRSFEGGNNSKKRFLSLNSTPKFSLSSNGPNTTYGYGPPFLFSLPEPVEDPWKFRSSPTLRRMGARPLSDNALRRRRRATTHLNGSHQINAEEILNEETDENVESIDEKPDKGSVIRSNSNDDWVHKLSRLFDLAPKFFLVIFLYKIFEFSWAVQQAVDIKVDEYSQEMLKSISDCSKSYLENRCTPGDRVPALEDACKRWEKCMNRDPTVFARAKVSAEAFGEIINNLMEQFSYKTMLFMVAIVLAIFVSRALVDLFKTRFLSDFTRPIPHDLHPSPTPMTPIQAHSITPMQHHISPGNSANRSMTPKRGSVGVYYVVSPTC